MLCSDVAGELAHKIGLSSVPEFAHVTAGPAGVRIRHKSFGTDPSHTPDVVR